MQKRVTSGRTHLRDCDFMSDRAISFDFKEPSKLKTVVSDAVSDLTATGIEPQTLHTDNDVLITKIRAQIL